MENVLSADKIVKNGTQYKKKVNVKKMLLLFGVNARIALKMHTMIKRKINVFVKKGTIEMV
jgi:hypothetical protein